MAGAEFIKFLPHCEVFVFQAGRFGATDHGIAGEGGPQLQLILFHEILHLVRVRTGGREGEVTLEVMQGVEGVVHLVVVKNRKPVMDVRRARRIVEGTFVEGDGSQVIAVRNFVFRVLDDLRASRGYHPVAAAR